MLAESLLTPRTYEGANAVVSSSNVPAPPYMYLVEPSNEQAAVSDALPTAIGSPLYYRPFSYWDDRQIDLDTGGRAGGYWTDLTSTTPAAKVIGQAEMTLAFEWGGLTPLV